MRYLLICLLLAGCATPRTTLINAQTGQIVVCGGSMNGSLVGGMIGYAIEKKHDESCVKSFKEDGFKTKKVEE